MNIEGVVARVGPLKRMLYPMYKRRKESDYEAAFKKRLKELESLNIEIRDRLNVLVVVADCLRFKNTSLSGYERDTTPFLSSLRNSGKAAATAPWTHPSVASIMTGLYPHNHGAYIHSKVRDFNNPRNIKGIRRKLLTLPEIAGANGYGVYFATSIDVATFPLRGRTPVRVYPAETRGEKIINDFLKWLEGLRERNFFAYLHLGDTHEPLNPPREFRDYFGRIKRIRNIDRWSFQRPEEQRGKKFEEFKRNKLLLYDNTIRYVDWLFERLYRELERRGLLESTLLVFTADHGEEFWEHAELEAGNFYDPRGVYGVGHGHNVFNEILEVPLAVEGPVKSMRMENRSLVDLAPTILEVWGVEPPYELDGRSLSRKPRKFLLSEATGYGYEKKALTVGGVKLLYAPEDGVEWVFLLERDPGETKPITDRELVEVMRKKLLSILARDEIKLKNSAR
ncbi:sulfatase [Thermococcus prieurii]